jgi:hypothetical protein
MHSTSFTRNHLISSIAHAALATVAAAGCATHPHTDEAVGASVDLAALARPEDASARHPPDCVVPWGIDWSDDEIQSGGGDPDSTTADSCAQIRTGVRNRSTGGGRRQFERVCNVCATRSWIPSRLPRAARPR